MFLKIILSIFLTNTFCYTIFETIGDLSTVRKEKEITIAVVDTGIDFNHPDLKKHLISGINLFNPNQLPQDDNGHGTNVAGVILTLIKNYSKKIPMNVQIMPIKAIEANGTTEETHIVKGITYAINHRVQIIVLSLGMNMYSQKLKNIVQNAEDKGILLIAASGNDGNSVKYPAAFPTVLAVGGISADKTIERNSNYGPELDVVAPWRVFTTINGGGYGYKEGTSMSAPQVAAACALILKKYPYMKPYQIRNFIRQTAEDLGSPGWDPDSGYGVLQIDQVLKEIPKQDIYENNNTIKKAKSIPINKTSYGSLNGEKDVDWFYFTAPYTGSVKIHITSSPSYGHMELTYYAAPNQHGIKYQIDSNNTTFNVKKGINYIKLHMTKSPTDYDVFYQITPELQIYEDDFENNDNYLRAYTLPSKSQWLIGTFSHYNDQDWYVIHFKKKGILKIQLIADTKRMDMVLRVMKEDKLIKVYDNYGDGETETAKLDSEKGNYYFSVSNIDEYKYPVLGEYIMRIEYSPRRALENTQ